MSEPLSLLNVLIVSGGGFQGLAVLKGLLQAGHIRVLVADCYAENVGRYFAHRYCVVPPIAQEREFLEALQKICAAESIQVLFPSTELELAFLAKHKGTFAARGIRTAVSDAEFLELVGDKKTLYTFLRQEGLPVPAIVDISASGVTFPLLGKPRTGWGGKGHLVLRSAAELCNHALADLQAGYVWQPWLRDFVEYSIDFAINFAGEISDLCLRERVRVSGGFAVIARQCVDERVSEIADRFARMAARRGGSGVFNLQILRAGKDCFISDVNARIGTSAVFGYGAGVNLPAFVCAPLAKPGAPRESSRRGHTSPLTMVRYLDELFVPTDALNGVRGVVFDLDDTLLSQKQWILDKLRGLYPEFKSKLPEEKEFLARAMMVLEEGNRSKLIDALCGHFALSAALGQELIQAYRAIVPRAARVYADVRPMLAELRRRGFRLAILTNNPPASQRQKIAAGEFESAFDEIIYAQELNAEKPARAGFLHVAERLKVSPADLVMVGDNLYADIAGALQAGFRHGFLMIRPGGFYNFDVGIFEATSGVQERFTSITSLRDILRFLGEAR